MQTLKSASGKGLLRFAKIEVPSGQDIGRRYKINKIYLIGFIFFSPFFLCSPVHAEEIRIVTPYMGTVENLYINSDYNLDTKDSSVLRGLYWQWVNTEKYQWNIFLYGSEDINYSTLEGAHLIFDYYFDVQETHKNVIGAGFEFIRVDMDAEGNFPPLSNFEMANNVYAPYIRGGRYFLFGDKGIKFSLMPWVGYEAEFTRGNISFNTPWPPFVVDKDIEGDHRFGLMGINFKMSVRHFFEVKTKYSSRFNNDEALYSTSVMTNLYFHKNWGISYRFKHFETTSGSSTYHIGGICYIF